MLLAELRSDRLVRIGDAGAGGNARRSVDIPPSLFQYRNFPFIRFDSCAILLGFSRHRPFFFSDCAGNAPPVPSSCGCCVAILFVLMLAPASHVRQITEQAIPPLERLAQSYLASLSLVLMSCSSQLLTKSTRIESGTFWNRKSWGASTSSEEKQKCVLILRSRQPPR